MAEAPEDEWRDYEDFAAGIDTYRLPNADLSGRALRVNLIDGPDITLRFQDASTVTWEATGTVNAPPGTDDPYDAVPIRDDVFYVHLPLTSVDRQALTIIFSTTTHRALGVHTVIQPEPIPEMPQVTQEFWSGITDGGEPAGEAPGPSRYLIGKRNIYRYSPAHLYEHVYMSSQRYAWQCLQGAQRGHGDMDLSTVWKFQEELYLFCFREFRIPVASVWLHDLGYALRTTGNFLGLNGDGEPEHSRAGGHIYPLGSVAYPDVQPV
ncbi:molybdenum cofactor biosynthesis protein MoaF [Actinobacteria bacterium YIM 96077]|uniref:Molybdenum cofactor biosynthesis protein MoaF n=1 Tax=Phytoactinopolyspora halophila TaxID=1981511 RepID=A0A329QJV8_9ACTN|nr:molybdenum cofactor biosynthesis protein MoaF [Actinobacteria bacterium YIM 96077]RAW12590.1 molybdenum cofactor biosynthesis protein MoaF [Phytoactinopolyspora halophila]